MNGMLPRSHLKQPLQRAHRQQQQQLVVRAAGSQVSTNDFKNGMMIEIDNAPWRVTEFQHVKPGKGAAFVRSKLKNQITGNRVERTFRAGEMVSTADVSKSDAQFTYTEGNDYVFMDLVSYEETRLPRDDSWAQFLKEGAEAQLVRWNDRVISVDLAKSVDLAVVETDPGVKGNTAQGGSKPAKLESGATVDVPLFIQMGEVIRIDTKESKYLGRAGS